MLIAHVLLIGLSATSQPAEGRWETGEVGDTIVVQMKSAPYPHESRAEGFKINDRVFPRHPHYTDSSVAIFIPKGYRVSERTDLLVYFHGHMNNVRKALDQYKLREQVSAAGRNVIFVFPEGPKDATDSGGGKLEDANGLKNLVTETLSFLKAEGRIRTTTPGRVLLAGHSGAYKVISYCVEHGGLAGNVTDVCLLDSSYARLEAYVDWAIGGSDRRLFSIFTDHLAGENVHLMTQLRKRGAAYELAAEQDADDALVAKTRLLFLFAEKLNHEQTVQWLERWLRTRDLPAGTRVSAG